MTTIVDQNLQVIGIFTDGDLRRTLDRQIDIHTTKVTQVMTIASKTITADCLAVDALTIMQTHKITALLVVNEQQTLIGVTHARFITSQSSLILSVMVILNCNDKECNLNII
ncbi:MAG: CBS domain-containing protein [Candidatus Marithrix sp.]